MQIKIDIDTAVTLLTRSLERLASYNGTPAPVDVTTAADEAPKFWGMSVQEMAHSGVRVRALEKQGESFAEQLDTAWNGCRNERLDLAGIVAQIVREAPGLKSRLNTSGERIRKARKRAHDSEKQRDELHNALFASNHKIAMEYAEGVGAITNAWHAYQSLIAALGVKNLDDARRRIEQLNGAEIAARQALRFPMSMDSVPLDKYILVWILHPYTPGKSRKGRWATVRWDHGRWFERFGVWHDASTAAYWAPMPPDMNEPEGA